MLNQWIREHRRHVRHMVVSTFLVAFALAAILFPSSSAAAADLTQEESQSAAAEPAQEVFLVARTSLPEKSTAEEVQLKEGQRVVIRWNDEEHGILAKDETVEELLDRLEVTVSPLDMVAVNAGSDPVEVTVGQEIVCYETVEEITESPVTYQYSSILPTWSETVVRQGQDGVHAEVYEVVYSGGEEISRQLVEVTDTPATETVIQKGTLENFAPNDAKVAEIVSNGDGTGKLVLENGQEITFNQTLTMKATAYTTGDPGVGTITASGSTVHMGTVGVERSQLPFGTKMYIVTSDGSYVYGFSIAEDTGGAIRKNRIDLYHNTYEECIQFGVRNCTVYILD